MSYCICDQGHISQGPAGPVGRAWKCPECDGSIQTSPGIEALCRQLKEATLPSKKTPMDEVREDVHEMVFGPDAPEPDRRSEPGTTIRRAAWENLREDIEQLRDDASRRYELATQGGDERVQSLYSAAVAAYDAALAAMRRRAIDLPTVSKYAHGYVHLLEALKALDQDETPEDELKITDPLRDIMDDVWWQMTPEELEARTTARGPVPSRGGKS
jgi:hypothetical protein